MQVTSENKLTAAHRHNIICSCPCTQDYAYVFQKKKH